MKIGIIADSLEVTEESYDLIKWMNERNNFELILAIVQEIPMSTTYSRINYHGIKGSIRRISFKFLSKLDKLITRIIYLNLNKLIIHKSLEVKTNIQKYFSNIIYIKPQFSKSGLVYRYKESDLDQIRNFDLDLIIRMGSGILRGEILSSAKYGIISFHHADNLINRGGPACFWEVFHMLSKTGFTIQILTEELDGGKVLKKGNFRTQLTYTANKYNVYKKSNYHMKNVLLDISNRNKLPRFINSKPYCMSLYTVPSIKEQLKYISYLFVFIIKKLYKRNIKKIFFRWGVSFSFNNWQNIILYKSCKIKNPSKCFLADPFVISFEGKYFCFVEKYSYIDKKATIAVYSLEKDSATYIGEAINEKFHLSYPFVFKYNKNFYMIPESSENNDVRLYKSTNFPLEWELERIIFNNVKASDSTVFFYKEKWWLFVNIDPSDSLENNSELFAYWSHNPIDQEWVEHKQNPIVIDSSSARMGGLLSKSGDIYLVNQSPSFNLYGKSAKIYKLNTLTEHSFEREFFCDITPDFSSEVIGIHHMNSSENCTVFDYLKEESIDL